MSTFPASILLALLAGVPLLAQQRELPRSPEKPLGVIDTILVSGNKQTHAYVILDEMTLRPGSVASLAAMDYDRARIYSLGLFTRVEILYDSLGGTRYLLVDVNERWYIYPIPILGFRDGDPKRVFFGAGLLHNNVRGRNQKLFASVVLGYDPGAGISFLDPLFDRDEMTSLSGGFSFSNVRNRSELEAAAGNDFSERHYSVHGALGKRYSLYTTGSMAFGFEAVAISSYHPGRTVSTNGRDEFFSASLSISFDSRDLAEYATRGMLLAASIEKSGLGESDMDVTRFSGDVRGYVPIGDLTAAGRMHASLATGGPIPTYMREYFGYREKVRGYYSTVLEGENILGGTAELRFPVVKPLTVFMQELPLPMEFKVWRFGMGLALFADAGAVWFRRNGLRRPDFIAGYGGGIHFLLPYSYVARVEYAWNDRGKGQIIFDLRGSI